MQLDRTTSQAEARNKFFIQKLKIRGWGFVVNEYVLGKASFEEMVYLTL